MKSFLDNYNKELNAKIILDFQTTEEKINNKSDSQESPQKFKYNRKSIFLKIPTMHKF